MRRYPPSTIYRYLDLPSKQIIQTHNRHTPPSQTLVQAAIHSPPPPNTTATKHRHISHFPHVPPGLVRHKPNPLTHSPQHLQPHHHPNTYTCHTLHLHLSPHSSLARHMQLTKRLNHVYHPYTHSPQPHLPRSHTSIAITLTPSRSRIIHTCNTNNST